MPRNMPQLRIIGPDGNEQWLELEGDEFTIGRDPNTDIPLTNKKVSRKHALVARADDGYVIRDFGSKNGLWVNGTPVDVFTRLWNRGGAVDVTGDSDTVDWWVGLPGQLSGAIRS